MSEVNAQERPVQTVPIWSAVANVIMERPHGPGGKEIRSGTRMFRPGAKVVYIYHYGTIDKTFVLVAGRHRGSGRLISSYVDRKWLVNWRVEMNYNPKIVQRVRNFYDRPGDWDEVCKSCGNKHRNQRILDDLERFCSGGEVAKAYMEALVRGFSGAWEGISLKEQTFVSTRTTWKQDLNENTD